MTERGAQGPGIPGEGGGIPGEAGGIPGEAGGIPGEAGGIPGEAGGISGPQLPDGPAPRSGTPGDGPSPHPGPSPPGPRRPAALAGAAVAGAVYAWFASATTPFTVPADVTTALPLLGMVAVVALQRLLPAGHVWQRLPADRPPEGGTAVPWIVLLALLLVPEGVSLLSGGARSSHPTISFVTDTVFRWHAVKAAVYLLWLWLCWYFVRR